MAGQGLAFVSGQLPLDADGQPILHLAIDEQARQVLAQVHAALVAAGCDWDAVLKVTVYLADVAHWAAFDHVYRHVLGTARPARAVVPVPALHHGVLVEVEAVAMLPKTCPPA